MNYTIEAFVDQLLQEKGMVNLDPEITNQLRSDLVARAENIINAKILEHMPASALAEFDSQLDSADAEGIQAFCRQHISNLDELVAEALITLRTIYLAGR